ncbi:hypothetical protein [Thalassotalea piscium]|uniref:DNA integrity scanning protein DisA with diadenylate cyclase activity n=1 Tax=Thalassotalea piscium TaxID=1230533 RepID=A0A7X0NJW3_9GAMM|nr:hypothetical protein [Thalassotalea piscium]MBB6544751.1 DNA integrity scanning protein DisA with diadenylate cyclase activity [Thalassotalea piscium]
MTTTIERKKQKKKSRVKNDITTMQLSRSLKARLIRIQEHHQFDKQDEALEEIISDYEETTPEVLLKELKDV